mgnify:CR=1 FL=1
MSSSEVVDKPMVSIAIPVYNQAATISQTIESALSAVQGLSGAEVIVSENHSNDGTSDVVAKYSSKVKVVRPDHHLGMAASWNYAVKCCSGQWVGMLSGDDQIFPSYIPALRAAISLDPDAVFAMGGWNTVNAQTGAKARRRVLSLPAVTKSPMATRALIHGPKASFASYCFLKAGFDAVGGFDQDYHLAQDWILQFRLSLLGSFVKTNVVIAEYFTGQDRADLEYSRVPLYLEDLATFCSSTIWEAAECGLPRLRILDACEQHIAMAESILARFPDWKSTGDEILRSAYERIGRERVAELPKARIAEVIAKAKQRVRQLAEMIIPA